MIQQSDRGSSHGEPGHSFWRGHELVRVHGHREEVHGFVGLHGDQLEHVQGFHVEGSDNEGTALVWTIPAAAVAILKTTTTT